MAKIKMRKTAVRMGYLDEKPTVYKLRQLTYPMVKPKDLVKYISNSANVPKSTVEAAIAAIVEAIVYYAIRGCRVSFEGFGGFYVGIQCKCAQTLKEANADTIKKRIIRFYPVEEVAELGRRNNKNIGVDKYFRLARISLCFLRDCEEPFLGKGGSSCGEGGSVNFGICEFFVCISLT